ncbi:methyl-accepting chemotaxis protein [Paenibacillus montaniterrae]|uniref:Methyl-accepting chemotaxis protein n=1 Tax=Paenibacillus montaniterrae TaxID=429341 RepID=A0A920CW47_9BACL|nr:methyl-accepting chemotaxis protein [Paenibacillus montaniterrae]GIP18892.1 methyl-accepting chemotaxis protein [Paenibacillus montaniterrae]
MGIRKSIVRKMVLGITVASLITYATSAFFLLVLGKMDLFSSIPTWLFVVGTLVLGVFWTGLFGFIATKWMLKPLLKVTSTVSEAATGNLKVESVEVHTRDEMYQLAEAVNGMLSRFRTIVNSIKSNSSLTDKHVQELQGAVNQTAIQLEGLAMQSEQITSGTSMQASSTSMLHSTADELYQSALHMQEEASEAKQRTEHMNMAATQSEEVFRSLVDGMRQLEQLNRDSLETIQQLSQIAEEIGNISSVVGGIADQTHLLALNAAIEAARAGEEGRGFVVVAQEVKSLADSSGQAVDEIRHLIEQVQQGVLAAVQSITAQYELSSQEAENGERFAKAFHQVKEEATTVAVTVEKMAALLAAQAKQAEESREQTSKVAQVAESIREGAQSVYDTSQQQAAIMEEIAASTDELRAKSSELLEKASYFRV